MRHFLLRSKISICLLLAFSAWISCTQSAGSIVMHTEMGDMRIRLESGLPSAWSARINELVQAAPDSLAIDGVLQDGFIQLNHRSAVATLTSEQTNTPVCGSFVWYGDRFYVVQGREHDDASLDKWERSTGKKLPVPVRERYKKNGGCLGLEGRCRVLGRLVSGKEVLDRLAALPHDAAGRPLKPVPVRLGREH